MIGYSQAKSEKILTRHIQDGFAIFYNYFPTKTATRFLVITTPGCYRSNITKTLKQIFYSTYVPIEKVRQVHKSEFEWGDVWGQIYWDKYHNKKSVATVRLDICRTIKTNNKEYQVWFVSGIPEAKFPRDLQSILKVLFGPNSEYHQALKAAIGEQYCRLISGYKILLNKTEFIPSLLNNNNLIRTMGKILETWMIQYTRDSN